MSEGKIHKVREFEPLQAIGIFWTSFGVLILIGILFSKTQIGRMTNGICGGILLAVGLFCYIKGRINKKKRLKNLERE